MDIRNHKRPQIAKAILKKKTPPKWDVHTHQSQTILQSYNSHSMVLTQKQIKGTE